MITSRSPRVALSLTLLVAIGSTTACSESDSSDAGRDTGPLMAPGEFYEAAVAAREAAARRCWTDPFHTGPLDLHLPQHAGAEIDALVANGDVVFDAAAAAECLAALASLLCTTDDLWEVRLIARLEPEACARALVGTHMGGSSCTSSIECDTWCNLLYGCPGFCNGGGDAGTDTGPIPDAGEVDADVSRCSVDDYPFCTHPVLSAHEGELCGTPDGVLCEIGLVCGRDWFPPNELRCERPYESLGRCHVAVPEGCPVGERCDGRACVPLPDEVETVPVGGACTPESHCSYRCSPAGVCVERTISYCPWYEPPPPPTGPPPMLDMDS